VEHLQHLPRRHQLAGELALATPNGNRQQVGAGVRRRAGRRPDTEPPFLTLGVTGARWTGCPLHLAIRQGACVRHGQGAVHPPDVRLSTTPNGPARRVTRPRSPFSRRRPVTAAWARGDVPVQEHAAGKSPSVPRGFDSHRRFGVMALSRGGSCEGGPDAPSSRYARADKADGRTFEGTLGRSLKRVPVL
jgi:hypothetical protein